MGERGVVMPEIDWKMLRDKAIDVSAGAYAPYSRFRVGAAALVDDGRVITGRTVTVAVAFAAGQPAMAPLPAEPFDPARLLQARVDGRARVCVRQNYYPVPAR